MSRLPAPTKQRNSLSWRDGRPRWEPSKSNREHGLKGKDLKDEHGRWMERGEATILADARTVWADAIRQASQPGAVGDQARCELLETIGQMKQPTDDRGRNHRKLVQDLIDRAWEIATTLEGAGAAPSAAVPWSPAALVEAYFADPRITTGENRKSDNTLKNYRSQGKRFVAKFGRMAIGAITRKMLMDWYEDELLPELSIPNANQCVAATAAFLKFAWNNEWISATPAVQLNLRTPNGRLIYWTPTEELKFVAWCDANNFQDIADGIVTGLWTGARIGDICAANLEDLKDEIWTFVPQKTHRKQLVAKPAIMPQARARLDRRAAAAASDSGLRFLNLTPFLWDFRANRRHTPSSFRRRFREAKLGCISSGAAPAGLEIKLTQDTRDTCVTRLYAAGVKIERMWSWTGHSQKNIEQILKGHYISLLDEGSREMAKQLQEWAVANGLAI